MIGYWIGNKEVYLTTERFRFFEQLPASCIMIIIIFRSLRMLLCSIYTHSELLHTYFFKIQPFCIHSLLKLLFDKTRTEVSVKEGQQYQSGKWGKLDNSKLGSSQQWMTLTCCQDHILTENIWFVWSETSYSGDKWRCYRCGTNNKRPNKHWR